MIGIETPVGGDPHGRDRISDWESCEARAEAEPGDRLVVDVEGFEGRSTSAFACAHPEGRSRQDLGGSRWLEQYLDFIADRRGLELEVAADYLVMAAWLASSRGCCCLRSRRGGASRRRGACRPPGPAAQAPPCDARSLGAADDAQTARLRGRLSRGVCPAHAHPHPEERVRRQCLRPAFQGLLSPAAPADGLAELAAAAAHGVVAEGRTATSPGRGCGHETSTGRRSIGSLRSSWSSPS